MNLRFIDSESTVVIGEGCEIGNNCSLADTILYEKVILRENVRLNNCIVDKECVLQRDFEAKDCFLTHDKNSDLIIIDFNS